MRVRIIFTVKNKGAAIPFHHQFILAQSLKGILLKGKDPEFITFPFYNFSGLKGQTRVSRNGLHYMSAKATLVVSSPNGDFLDYLISNLFKLPQLDVANLSLIPESVEREMMPEFGSMTKFICISPIVLSTPDVYDESAKRFIPPQDDQFSDLLYEGTMERLENYGYSPEDIASFFKFQVVPDKAYLKKISDANKKFARIYPVYDQDVKYEVRGYTLPFNFYADPKVQEFVFTCGIGNFCHKGFGMLDIANSDPIKRAVEYPSSVAKAS